MASRSETIPEHFLKHLGESIPGFNLESVQHQHALAHMAWMGINNANRHSHMEGAMTFSYVDLDRTFGRSNFIKVNRRLGFFNRTADWSMAKGYTRGYYFSEQVRLSIAKYLDGAPWTSTTRLVMADGKALRALPRAVASKDKSGVTTTAWDSASKLNLVQVNLEEVARVKSELLTACADWRVSEDTAGATSYPELANFERVVEMIDKVCRMAMTERWHISHGP